VGHDELWYETVSFVLLNPLNMNAATIVIHKMKPMTQKINYQFDFEIGTLVKSPCLQCHIRPLFPQCMQTCRLLDEIHTVLAEAVSCTRRV